MTSASCWLQGIVAQVTVPVPVPQVGHNGDVARDMPVDYDSVEIVAMDENSIEVALGLLVNDSVKRLIAGPLPAVSFEAALVAASDPLARIDLLDGFDVNNVRPPPPDS